MKGIKEFFIYELILIGAGAVGWAVCVVGLSLLGCL